MREIRNKPIVVTGAGKSHLVGYGAQMAKDLYESGAIVHIVGRHMDRLHASRVWAGAEHSDRFYCHVADVSNADQINRLFEEIKGTSGLVYGLVNNAAINPSRNYIGETTLADFEETLRTNLIGPFNCMKAAIPQMLERGEGNIVSITSIFAHIAAPKQTSYAPSKHGLQALTDCVGLQYCRQGIAANCVAPGYAYTDLTASLFDSLSPEGRASFINAHAIRREVTPREVSDAVLFLLKVTPATVSSTVRVEGGFLHNPPRI